MVELIRFEALSHIKAEEFKDKGKEVCFRYNKESICGNIIKVNQKTASVKMGPRRFDRVPLGWLTPKEQWKENYVPKRKKYGAVSDADYTKSRATEITPIPNYKIGPIRTRVKRMASCLDSMRDVRSKCSSLKSAKCKASFEPDRKCVETNAQEITNLLNDYYKLPNNHVTVNGTRPMTYKGVVFPYTRARQDVVANKQMLETLVHEWNHHYDYRAIGLSDSPHTAGFNKRTSTINKQLKTTLD